MHFNASMHFQHVSNRRAVFERMVAFFVYDLHTPNIMEEINQLLTKILDQEKSL